MRIHNRILKKNEGPFKRGLEFEEGWLSSLMGDPLLAIVNWAPDSPARDELENNLYGDSDITNVKHEILTGFHFGSVNPEVLKNIHLYYVQYEGRRIEMDYLEYYDGKNYDSKLVDLVLYDILPITTPEYSWLNLKGSRGPDSNIYYLESTQVEEIFDTLCLKVFPDSHPLLGRVSLELIA